MLTHTQQVKKLYKTIMRLHRALPKELRELGNNYVRDEFKRHKNAKDNEVNTFMNEWAGYALTLAEQVGVKGICQRKPIGANFSESDLQNFQDEQLCQLYELMLATKGLQKDPQTGLN